MASDKIKRRCIGILVSFLLYETISTCVSAVTAHIVRARDDWRPDVWKMEIYDPSWLTLVTAASLIASWLIFKPRPFEWALPFTLGVLFWMINFSPPVYEFIEDECQIQAIYDVKPMVFFTTCVWLCGIAVGFMRWRDARIRDDDFM